MGPIGALKSGFSQLTVFDTRASRAEYWWMFLASSVLSVAYQAIFIAIYGLPTEFAISTTEEVSRAGAEGAVKTAFLFNGTVFLFCALMLPVTARRFKDRGWRGRWFGIAWVINFLNLVVIAFGLIASATGEMRAFANWFVVGFVFMALPYCSAIWTVWIGFVRPDPEDNAFGLAPTEVTA